MKIGTCISIVLSIQLLVSSCINNNVKRTEAIQSEAIDSTEISYKTPFVDIFVEVSGSMNGYLNAYKQEGALSNLIDNFTTVLATAKGRHEISGVNLYFINGDNYKLMGSDENIDDFIKGLTTPSIVKSAINTSTSNIADDIATILQQTDNDTLTVFISDCIFSPGKVSDPSEVLDHMTNKIQRSLSSYISKNPSLAAAIWQYMVPFKGYYYDHNDKPRNINQERPAYFVFFGNPLSMSTINSLKNSLSRKPLNEWTITSSPIPNNVMPTYSILRSTSMNGKYSIIDNHTIKKLGKTPKGVYKLTIGANLKELVNIYGIDYVKDTANYIHDPSFKLSIEDSKVQVSNFTHNIVIFSEKPLASKSYSIKFMGTEPAWLENVSDDDDTRFDHGNEAKTYGFKSIPDGIFQILGDKPICEYNFNIK